MSDAQHVAIPMRPGERRMLRVFRTGFRVLSIVAPEWGGRLACRLFTTPRRYSPPAFEGEIKAEGEALVLDHAGATLHGHRWGEGPTVLLIHGWEGRGAQLGHFVRPLVAAGYTVVAYDGPAHGKSDGKRTDGHHFATSLMTIAAAHGPVHGVVAHSFGGAASQYALSLGFRPERLVLIGVPDRLSNVLHRFRAILRLPESIYSGALKHLGRRFEGDPRSVSFLGYDKGHHPPTLVIHDKGDREVPYSEGYALYESLRYGEHMATEGLGHRRILKDSAVVRTAVEFITGG